MATVVHKLSTLHSLGQSLLVQLYNVRTYLTDARIRPDFAKPENAKLAKALTAKFPDPPALDKVRCSFAPQWVGRSILWKCVCVSSLRRSNRPLLV